MDYLPLFTRLTGAACLVVGGGTVAARKIRLLLRSGAKVTVVAPVAGAEVAELGQLGKINYLAREFAAGDIHDLKLVIAATDDAETNALVAATANARNCLCNVVDNLELSSAILPAIVDRSPLMIAVSSGGKSPVLTTQIRQRIETLLPANYGMLAEWTGRWRTEVKSRVATATQRLHFWQQILSGRIADQVLHNQIETADTEMRIQIKTAAQTAESRGVGWLVGAGPGDPELLTLKALRCLETADVVIHDRLVASDILKHARRDAEIISAGKVAGQSTIKQTDINDLLVDKVRAGLRVCRLKGGDPFIFGRGGEELEALARAGLDYEVVPGITAASGCAAALGIPLTHREVARSLTFVTGQTASGEEPNWSQLAGPDQTLVMYMSLRTLARACEQLMTAGRPADCPALLVENGTTSQQRSIASSLSMLPKLAAAKSFQSPALLIVGDVAAWAASDPGLPADAEQPWLPAGKPASNLPM